MRSFVFFTSRGVYFLFVSTCVKLLHVFACVHHREQQVQQPHEIESLFVDQHRFQNEVEPLAPHRRSVPARHTSNSHKSSSQQRSSDYRSHWLRDRRQPRFLHILGTRCNQHNRWTKRWRRPRCRMPNCQYYRPEFVTAASRCTGPSCCFVIERLNSVVVVRHPHMTHHHHHRLPHVSMQCVSTLMPLRVFSPATTTTGVPTSCGPPDRPSTSTPLLYNNSQGT